MKVTVLTPSRNSAQCIEGALSSVRCQTYPHIEHIVIDGMSTDQTPEILESHQQSGFQVIRGRDKSMYDAINKGLMMATGDVVAILNSDDVYADQGVIRDIVAQFEVTGADCVYGDIAYVKKIDLNQVVRYWRSGVGQRLDIERGWMPPHTALFIKKSIYDQNGPYDISYQIAADYEMILRLLYTCQISSAYLPRLCTKMRLGGMSNGSVSGIIKKSSEDYRACKAHHMSHPGLTVVMKNVRKLPQYMVRF
jgi:glycosyltransferase